MVKNSFNVEKLISVFLMIIEASGTLCFYIKKESYMVGMDFRIQNALLVRNDEKKTLHIKSIYHMCLVPHVIP